LTDLPAILIAAAAALLVVARWAAAHLLERLNQRQVLAHASAVPEALRQTISPETYAKAVEYTLAKSRFFQAEVLYDTAVLLTVLWSGLLPRAYYALADVLGPSAWGQSAGLLVLALGLSIFGLPFEWYAQFRLEERFGFNTTTQRLWWVDRLKGWLLGIALGYPLLLLTFKLLEWAGPGWWFWTWVCLLAVQILLTLLAPILILPLFNKFTPLPEGTLRDRLLGLADKTAFRAQSIQVMDGSKRSRHSNAFFTGFGRFRRIVLFDTLIQQLSEPEVEAVLAHEIGHYKRRHVAQMLLLSAVGLLGGLYVLAWLSRQQVFYRAFGFQAASLAPALLLFALLSGATTFWLSPLWNAWCRRHEYQADAFAAAAVGTPDPLIQALRKLTEKNLSNLTPHPAYSAFHYSHPTLLERERALAKAS
jgi:STE24 endopeptidase